MARPIHATIHTVALRANLMRMRAAAPGARVWAVVKANAYGHGLELAYAGLQEADGFALLELAEAERLRRLGWRRPILLLEGVFEPAELPACAALAAWQVVHCDEQIEWLAAFPQPASQHVFLAMNSGMNRLGFSPAKFRAAYARLKGLPAVANITLMTHFADADRDDGIAAQWAVFQQGTAGLTSPHSVCNSAATLRHGGNPSVRGAWVRAGIALYGSSPDYPQHDIAHWGLAPAMSLRAKVISITDVAAGASVGYGSAYTAQHPMRVATVACGYADGYPRHAPTGTPVLIDGARTRTLGRVSMDMLAIDLGPAPQARRGSEVTLWGQSCTGALLPIDEVAHAAGTIGYELMCALAQRVPAAADEGVASLGQADIHPV